MQVRSSNSTAIMSDSGSPDYVLLAIMVGILGTCTIGFLLLLLFGVFVIDHATVTLCQKGYRVYQKGYRVHQNGRQKEMPSIMFKKLILTE